MDRCMPEAFKKVSDGGMNLRSTTWVGRPRAHFLSRLLFPVADQQRRA